MQLGIRGQGQASVLSQEPMEGAQLLGDGHAKVREAGAGGRKAIIVRLPREAAETGSQRNLLVWTIQRQIDKGDGIRG